jgi:hypothetical protein
MELKRISHFRSAVNNTYEIVKLQFQKMSFLEANCKPAKVLTLEPALLSNKISMLESWITRITRRSGKTLQAYASPPRYFEPIHKSLSYECNTFYFLLIRLRRGFVCGETDVSLASSYT